jgi:hypothetical protein
MKYVKEPWLFSWFCWSIDRKDNAHDRFLFFGELPYNELVVFAMTVTKSDVILEQL